MKEEKTESYVISLCSNNSSIFFKYYDDKGILKTANDPDYAYSFKSEKLAEIVVAGIKRIHKIDAFVIHKTQHLINYK